MAAKHLKDLLRPGDTILVGTGTGEPVVLIDELIEASATIPGLTAIQVMTGGIEQLAAAAGPHLRLKTPVPGPQTRKAINAGRAELLLEPMSGLLRGIQDGSMHIDGVLMMGRAIDAHWATPGLIADIMVPAWESARFRALELNDRVPRIACATPLELARADHIVHSSRLPNELPEDPPSALATHIGALVADLLPDGATFELGIGRALAGVVDGLIAQRRDLAMHTGIVGNAAKRLIEAACVSRPVRGGTAYAVGATSMGTQAFYAWADGNERIALVDSRLAHHSAGLALLPKFVAINSVMQLDLTGNANSISHHGKMVAGPGGAGDFCAAGAAGAGSIMVLFSTARDGASTILPAVEAISVPAAHVTHVVTEHGVAHLANRSPEQRARAMIAIAAPEHRDALARSLT